MDSPGLLVPPLGPLTLAPDPEHLLGEPPQVLEQDQAKHRGQGPQLADGQGRDLLERLDETRDPRLIELAVGVRDKCQGQGVDPGVARERARTQLRQHRVVAARKILTNLPQHLVDDMEIVGQPVGIEALDLLAVVSQDLAPGSDQDALVLDESLQAGGWLRAELVPGHRPWQARVPALPAVPAQADPRESAPGFWGSNKGELCGTAIPADGGGRSREEELMPNLVLLHARATPCSTRDVIRSRPRRAVVDPVHHQRICHSKDSRDPGDNLIICRAVECIDALSARLNEALARSQCSGRADNRRFSLLATRGG